MPYLVRAKGRSVRLRDLGRDGHPMIEVGSEPVLMLDIPYHTKRVPGGGNEVEVVEVVDATGYEPPAAAKPDSIESAKIRRRRR